MSTIKTVMFYVMCGAASTLGGVLMIKAIKVAVDPYQKALAKQKFSDIKSKLKKK